MAKSHFPVADHITDQFQSAFLVILPRIERFTRSRFRHIACPDRRQDCVREAVALCWLWYARLARRGRDPDRYVTALARYAAASVRSGRRLCGQERARDVFSPLCQLRRDFAVTPLPDGSGPTGNAFAEALYDNAQTPVPEQVQFRLDFPAWLATLPAHRRDLVGQLALGHRTQDLAGMFRLTPGRVAQLRREFHRGYERFCAR